MGKILKAFAVQSSGAAKKANVWHDVIEALNECTTLDEVASFEEWVKVAHWNLPYPYRDPLADAVEAHVQQILTDEEILRRWGE